MFAQIPACLWTTRQLVRSAPCLVVIAASLCVGGCAETAGSRAGGGGTENMAMEPLSEDAVLRDHIGRVITLRGEVTNTRFATIRGVRVRSQDPDLRKQQALATGVLRRWEVTQEQIERRYGGSEAYAAREPGPQYGLFDVEEPTRLAQVRPASR